MDGCWEYCEDVGKWKRGQNKGDCIENIYIMVARKDPPVVTHGRLA